MKSLYDVNLVVLKILAIYSLIMVFHTILLVPPSESREKVRYVGTVDRIETNDLAVILIEERNEEILIPVSLIEGRMEHGWISLEIGSHQYKRPHARKFRDCSCSDINRGVTGTMSKFTMKVGNMCN